MPKILATFMGEGFPCDITEDEDGRVHFMADADIDADGANGQNGHPAAYMVGDKGSEALANGGMKMAPGGIVVFAEPWGRDIVVTGPRDIPQIFPGGILASKTAYRFWGVALDDPSAYVDAATVPYIVVPPVILQKTSGAVLGCRCHVTFNGLTCIGVVADIGPRKKCGEISIAMADALRIPSSPRRGGVDKPHLTYELWPGIPAEIQGQKFRLQRSNGSYV